MCGEKRRGKDANVTTAWFDFQGIRHAYRQYICVGCYAQHIAPLEVASEATDMLCPVCRVDASDNLDPVYYTIYIPGSGPLMLELSTDPACAAILRSKGQLGARELENRPIEGLGPGPSYTSVSAWDELGLGRRRD